MTLVLVPHDDSELAAYETGLGQDALRAGRDVYFRHVLVGDLPPPVADTGLPTGSQRTTFEWNGSIHSHEVAGPDGS